jgi:DNA polymerase III delta subunit
VWDVLRRYIQRPSPTTVLALLHTTDEPDPAIAAVATRVDVAPLAGDALRQWANERALAAGLRFEPQALVHLLRAVGDDLAHLTAEIDKLAGALGGNRPATAEDVAQFVGVRHGETLEDWVTAVLQRDVRRAARLVDRVLALPGITGVRMVMALGTELVGLALTRTLVEQGITGRRLEQTLLAELRQIRPPGARDWADLAASWAALAALWTGPELHAAIEAALETDAALKSTTVSDETGLLHGLVLGLSRQDRAA